MRITSEIIEIITIKSFKNDLKVLMKGYFSEIKKLFSKNKCEK
jgi:hypothetical protein